MNACRTPGHMDSGKERTINWNFKPSLIESRLALHCNVADCKREGTYAIKSCNHCVCGECLRSEEKLLNDEDKTENVGYVCPVCIQQGWSWHSWVSMKSIFLLLEEMVFCMQCLNYEAVCRVNCEHLFCLKCLNEEEGHPNLPIVCKVKDCSKTIKKHEKDYLSSSINELMVWNKIKFPDNQRCHECCPYKQAILVLRQCNHGYCHSCVQKLKNHPDPERSTALDMKILRCTYFFCKTTLPERIVENYMKLLQPKEKMIAMVIELSIQDCYGCLNENKAEIKIRNKSCYESHIYCKHCFFEKRDNVKTSVSKQNHKLKSSISCPAAWCKTTTPSLYLETIFDNIFGKSCEADIFLRKSTLHEKCGNCKQKYACMTRLSCSHGICGTCAKNDVKLNRTLSICDERSCNNIIPVTSINKFLQENSDLVALNCLETVHQGACVGNSNAAENDSTGPQKQQRSTSCEEEFTSKKQTESELTITMSYSEHALCELCHDLAVVVIGNCLHRYCLKCISVLLTSLSSNEKRIQCVAENCKTLICIRRLKQFSLTPIVKQKEMCMYFEVKQSECGIRRCKYQGIIKARNCNHSFCLECLQKCTPGEKCEETSCPSLNLPPTDHFEMLITPLLSKTTTEIFPFIFTQNKTVHHDLICSCTSKGSLKIVRCGHTMCKKCVKDTIKNVVMVHKQGNITIARCNVSTCREIFILPMYGAWQQQNEIKERDSEINQANISSKRPNETEIRDSDNAGTMAISEQETSSYFAATKKKIKLEKGNGVGDKVEKTRTLDKGNNTGGRKTESLGLRNVGFSCYRNCILQVLAETPYFLERLESFLDRPVSSSQEERNKWIHHLQTVLVGIKTKSTDDHNEELHQFHHEFNKSNPEYREYVQEDCLSFLTTLLNGMQEMLQEKHGTSMNPAGLFNGKWKDIYKCLKCSTEDYYNESEFFYLPLPYKEKNNKRTTIGSCLLGLFEKEMVDLFTCSKCGNARMSKELVIESFPMILVLQFSKLSEANDESNQDISLRKKANIVQFWDHFNGLTNNELKKKIGKDTLTPYRLFGVVVHLGSESSGHYISFVKRKDRQNWQKCDDSYVCDVSLRSVLESNAYLLFYERCETQIE